MMWQFIKRFGLFIVLISLFFLSLFLVDDYGISWDEPQQREIGIINYKYIFESNPELLDFGDKYYGSVYEVLLVIGEKVFKLSDTRDIYLFRHTANFSLFFVGCIVFALLIHFIWKSKFLAILGFIFLFTSPRIFADSFYNSKDIPFLVFYLLSTYSYLLYFGQRSLKKIVLHGFFTALSISSRVAGGYVLLATVFLQLILLSQSLLLKEPQKTKQLLQEMLIYICICGISTYVLWPILWSNPLNFLHAIELMKNYDWDLTVLFRGEFVQALNLPWNYLLVWISVTTPIALLVVFILGVAKILLLNLKIIFGLLKRKLVTMSFSERQILPLSMLLFWPLLSVIYFKPTLYDGWRHFYFIFPLFVVLAIYGIQEFITLKFFKQYSVGKYITGLIIAIYIIEVFSFSINNHPHQFVYFNFLAGKNYEEIKKTYELDYWAVSSREVLENIILHNSGNIKIATDIPAIGYNQFILKKAQRDKISFAGIEDMESADIFIGSYRWHPEAYPCDELLYSSSIDGIPLISAYRANSCK